MLKLNLEQDINKLTEKISSIEEVVAIILFGSFARGDFGPKSDIDLFILVQTKRCRQKIENTISNFKAGRLIQLIIRTEKELKKTDIGLLQNIFQEGKILFSKKPLNLPVNLLLKQKPYLIFIFDLKQLTQIKKVKFNTALYGISKKNYKYKGLLEINSGKRLGSGCIMAPYIKKKVFEDLFNGYELRYEIIEVWQNI